MPVTFDPKTDCGDYFLLNSKADQPHRWLERELFAKRVAAYPEGVTACLIKYPWGVDDPDTNPRLVTHGLTRRRYNGDDTGIAVARNILGPDRKLGIYCQAPRTETTLELWFRDFREARADGLDFVVFDAQAGEENGNVRYSSPHTIDHIVREFCRTEGLAVFVEPVSTYWPSAQECEPGNPNGLHRGIKFRDTQYPCLALITERAETADGSAEYAASWVRQGVVPFVNWSGWAKQGVTPAMIRAKAVGNG